MPINIVAIAGAVTEELNFDCEIDIAVQQKIDPTLAKLDGLMEMVEKIADQFRTNPLNALPDARCKEPKRNDDR
jgi:hypothetical protein